MVPRSPFLGTKPAEQGQDKLVYENQLPMPGLSPELQPFAKVVPYSSNWIRDDGWQTPLEQFLPLSKRPLSCQRAALNTCSTHNLGQSGS